MQKTNSMGDDAAIARDRTRTALDVTAKAWLAALLAAPVVCASRAATPFAEVESHGRRGSSELLLEVNITSRGARERRPERADEIEGEVVGLKGRGFGSLGSGFVFPRAQVP